MILLKEYLSQGETTCGYSSKEIWKRQATSELILMLLSNAYHYWPMDNTLVPVNPDFEPTKENLRIIAIIKDSIYVVFPQDFEYHDLDKDFRFGPFGDFLDRNRLSPEIDRIIEEVIKEGRNCK